MYIFSADMQCNKSSCIGFLYLLLLYIYFFLQMPLVVLINAIQMFPVKNCYTSDTL